MKNRLQQAIRTGYIEYRPHHGIDEEANSYFAHCRRMRRPYVLFHRLRGHCRVEADLITTALHFTEDFHQRALGIFRPFVTNELKCTLGKGSVLISCDYIGVQYAQKVAAQLFVLASSAPRSPSFPLKAI